MSDTINRTEQLKKVQKEALELFNKKNTLVEIYKIFYLMNI